MASLNSEGLQGDLGLDVNDLLNSISFVYYDEESHEIFTGHDCG